jgi:hypothetical protein
MRRASTRTLPKSGGRRVEVRERLCRPGERALEEKSWGERMKKVSEVAKRAERRKKSNGEPECPRIRDNQQREEGKQCALRKEKATATPLE